MTVETFAENDTDLSQILSDLEFETIDESDDKTCQAYNGSCSLEAVWVEKIKTACIHDGVGCLFCDHHKKIAEFYVKFYKLTCKVCQVPLLGTTYERI